MVQLKHYDRLHTKVYLSPDRLLVGSANASTNGLWDEGLYYQGTVEAMIHTNDAGPREMAQNWFNSLWNNTAKTIALDDALLKRTEAAYRNRDHRPTRDNLLNVLLENQAFFGRRIWLNYIESEATEEAELAADEQETQAQVDEMRVRLGDDWIEGGESLTSENSNDVIISINTRRLYSISSVKPFVYKNRKRGGLIWLKNASYGDVYGTRFSKNDLKLLTKIITSLSDDEIKRMIPKSRSDIPKNRRGYFKIEANGERNYALHLEDLSDDVLLRVSTSLSERKRPTLSG